MDDNIPPSVRPRDKSFAAAIATVKQQDLSSYTCTFSPRCVISLYFAIALVFIPLGSALLAGTVSIRRTGKQVYSSLPDCIPKGNDISTRCIVKFRVPKTIPAPSYMYYSLTDFHQNARKYAKSRSDVMNMGKVPTTSLDVSTCEPWLYKPNTSEGERGFDPTEFRYPCGLTAFSTFNDTFELCKDEDCNQRVQWRKKGIAWWTDVQHKFRPNPQSVLFNQTVEDRPSARDGTSANDLLQDEDFIVWMRLSAFRDFDKLYRIIEEDLPGDSTFYVRVNSTFPVSGFNGTKAFEVSTVKWFGGRNSFLGAAYVFVGMVSLLIASLLLATHVCSPQSSRPPDPAIWLRDYLHKLDME